MQLTNLRLVGQNELKRIHIENGRIVFVGSNEEPEPGSVHDKQLFFKEAIAFPGLINSHDHLDFNLFPRLGNHIYNSYTEWGTDIHRNNAESISRVLNIPRHLRVQWGIYKNLLSGITTVAHHGAKPQLQQDLISVCQEADSFHSVSGEKGWRLKLVNPFKKNKPVVIHIGEGTVPAAFEEINDLIRWNIFHRTLIGIHGVAMNEKQAASFRSLVWCPAANYFILNKTANIGLLKQHTKILFGTDATLSASWNIWEHLRLARDQRMVSDTELFDMLTTAPADIWGLENSGSIAVNQWADIIVAKPAAGVKGWDAFYGLNPEDILLVMHKGNIRLFDQDLHDQLKQAGYPLNDFYKICLGDNVKYVQGDLPGLMKEIRVYHPLINFPVTPCN